MTTGRWKKLSEAVRRQPLRALLLLCAGGALLVALTLASLWSFTPDVAGLADGNPRTTALMDQRVKEAREKGSALKLRQSWRRLEEISPRLQWAVILSEDASFFGHDGFDWDELQKAMKRNLEKGAYVRGASTLTQQLAKNIYLGTEKSLWRKIKEAVLAAKLERALSKKRILALYLNVVEWDAGTFGAEAGAQARFGTSASALSAAQASVLAAMLPAPLKTQLSQPSPWLQRRAFHVLDLLYAAKKVNAMEYALGRSELTLMFERGPRLDETAEGAEGLDAE